MAKVAVGVIIRQLTKWYVFAANSNGVFHDLPRGRNYDFQFQLRTDVPLRA